jgi:hypothetical protein
MTASISPPIVPTSTPGPTASTAASRACSDVAVDVNPDIQTDHLVAELGVIVAGGRRVRSFLVNRDVDRERQSGTRLSNRVFGVFGDFELGDARFDHRSGLGHRFDENLASLAVAVDCVVIKGSDTHTRPYRRSSAKRFRPRRT